MIKEKTHQKECTPIHLWEMTYGQQELMHSRIASLGMSVVTVTIYLCPPHLRDQHFENHHALYWKYDRVFEASVNKMDDTRGRLKPEKVRNFANPLISFMSIFTLVYWKIISRETNDNAKYRLAMQVSNNRRQTIYGARWTHYITYQENKGFSTILIQMVSFPLPGVTYIAYWWYGSVIFSWTSVMHLRRFKQIRSVLYFNSNLSGVKCKDVMHETRPILNTRRRRWVHSSFLDRSCLWMKHHVQRAQTMAVS
jgi:hypothetical protein